MPQEIPSPRAFFFFLLIKEFTFNVVGHPGNKLLPVYVYFLAVVTRPFLFLKPLLSRLTGKRRIAVLPLIVPNR